jgi:hypothetical protein
MHFLKHEDGGWYRFESVELQEQLQEEDGLIINEAAEDNPR